MLQKLKIRYCVLQKYIDHIIIDYAMFFFKAFNLSKYKEIFIRSAFKC